MARKKKGRVAKGKGQFGAGGRGGPMGQFGHEGKKRGKGKRKSGRY